jgi:hypothetical protein
MMITIRKRNTHSLLSARTNYRSTTFRGLGIDWGFTAPDPGSYYQVVALSAQFTVPRSPVTFFCPLFVPCRCPKYTELHQMMCRMGWLSL